MTADSPSNQDPSANGESVTARDLMETVRSGTRAQRKAVAEQASISPGLAEALVETGDAEVIATLLSNHSAEISERLLLKCLDLLPDSEQVHRAMVGRARVPVTVAQCLVTLASGRLSDEVIARHALPPAPAGEHAELGRKRPQWWSHHMAGYFR
ncbi:MAG: DUF2336 domain-containing protein [Rhodospirillales bacterium]|nr:DUF2336 domain-containing protein [Rhodospirillales bacterium]